MHDAGTEDEASAIDLFVRPLEPAILPPCQSSQRAAAPRRSRKLKLKAIRRSVRLAAATWPRGDSQNRARMVLMKRLGITQEEEQPNDDTLLRYFNLFRGPLTDLVLRALVALSGLDGSAAVRRAAA